MNDKLGKIIVDSAREVFEQMAFLEVSEETAFEDALGNTPADTDRRRSHVQIKGTMAFKGRFEGTISVAYSQELARILAANILGLDEDEINVPEDIVDSVREVTNMISGGVLTRLTEQGEPVDLSVPRVGIIDDESDLIDDDSVIVIEFNTEAEQVRSKLKCITLDMY